MECTKCNASVMDGAAYCVNCGALLEGKTACAGCGTVYEGNFCPACGTAKKAVKADEGKNKSTFAKISDIIGGASMMLGVIFPLLRIFHRTYTPRGNGRNASDAIGKHLLFLRGFLQGNEGFGHVRYGHDQMV